MTPKSPRLELASLVGGYYDDPLMFVRVMFPWKEPGTLANQTGPRAWQEKFLADLGAMVRSRRFNGLDPVQPILMSVVSGHGVGKSALVAWICLWIMATRPNCKGIVTANTSIQLQSKTWSELGKWVKLCRIGHWFGYSSGDRSMVLKSIFSPESWRVEAITWRIEQSEAFAGLHCVDSTPFYVFDEASAIPDKILEVADGGLTDGEPMMFLFGNGTRNTGRFKETFGKLRHRWDTRQIDSRTVEGTNKELFAQWEADHGAESDFFKVRVRGMFPASATTQFISEGDVDNSIALTVEDANVAHMPLIFGVDVARFGDDDSCLVARRGRKVMELIPWSGLDTMQLASMVAREIDKQHPDAVFVDGCGLGAGVVDRLRSLGYHQVIDVQSAASPNDPKAKCGNLRAEMWSSMRDAIKVGLDLPDEQRLKDDLIGPDYFYNANDELMIESKKSMKARGLASPDRGDALAMTYAYPVRSTGRSTTPTTRPARNWRV
ncbi:MAG: terminase [Magnetococcales bacterium]|nr:terminase [Magnetococcales bacterium]